jgi:Domain of unknown function (DUF4430)
MLTGVFHSGFQEHLDHYRYAGPEQGFTGDAKRKKASTHTGTKRALAFVLTLLLVAAAASVSLHGCATAARGGKTAESGSVTVYVTRDFGRGMIKQGMAAGGGRSVLDALKEVARVETEYGGGFVSAIEGLKSNTDGGRRSDWFFYMNGALAAVGAGQLEVRPGDCVWWDFHQWNETTFIPTVIGAYPMPFTRGYSGARKKSILRFGEGMETAAGTIARYLEKEGARVQCSPLAGSSKPPESGPAMVVLSPKEAGAVPWVRELLDGDARNGAFVTVDATTVIPLDSGGKPVDEPAGVSAAVVSTGTGMGDTSPIWLVLCDGAAGTQKAVDTLTSDPQKLRRKFGLLVDSSGKLLSLPR